MLNSLGGGSPPPIPFLVQKLVNLFPPPFKMKTLSVPRIYNSNNYNRDIILHAIYFNMMYKYFRGGPVKMNRTKELLRRRKRHLFTTVSHSTKESIIWKFTLLNNEWKCFSKIHDYGKHLELPSTDFMNNYVF